MRCNHAQPQHRHPVPGAHGAETGSAHRAAGIQPAGHISTCGQAGGRRRGGRRGTAASCPRKAGRPKLASPAERAAWDRLPHPPWHPREGRRTRGEQMFRVQCLLFSSRRGAALTPGPRAASELAGRGDEGVRGDSCFHLVSVQVGQAGAGGPGMRAPVQLVRNANLLLHSGRMQNPGRGMTDAPARGTENPGACPHGGKGQTPQSWLRGAGPRREVSPPAGLPAGAGHHSSGGGSPAHCGMPARVPGLCPRSR